MAYTIGLDIGSTYTKGIILDADKNIVGRAMRALFCCIFIPTQ